VFDLSQGNETLRNIAHIITITIAIGGFLGFVAVSTLGVLTSISFKIPIKFLKTSLHDLISPIFTVLSMILSLSALFTISLFGVNEIALILIFVVWFFINFLVAIPLLESAVSFASKGMTTKVVRLVAAIIAMLILVTIAGLPILWMLLPLIGALVIAFANLCIMMLVILLYYGRSRNLDSKRTIATDKNGKCYLVIMKSMGDGWACKPYIICEEAGKAKPAEHFEIKSLSGLKMEVIDYKDVDDFVKKKNAGVQSG